MSGLAGRQFGRVARRQLLPLGVSDDQIAWWLGAGYLLRRLPGVYAVGHAAPSVEAELSEALLYAGPAAVLSHATAAWWLGLHRQKPPLIDLSTPRRCRGLSGIVVHDRRTLPRNWHRGLPTGPVAHVLRDYAWTAEDEYLRRALAEAEYQGWLDLDAVRAVLRRGQRGSAALRRALTRHEPRLALTRSELERRLLALCQRFGLPLPECNVTIDGMLVDALWREERVVVEVDGRRGHQTWAQIQRDRERELRLRNAGFVVLRYVWRQLEQEPEAVASDLGRALSPSGP